MTTRVVKLVVVLSIVSGVAAAQFLQNVDISIMFGRSVVASQTVPGTGVKVTTSGGFTYQVAYGYQLLSTKRGHSTIAGTDQKAADGISSTIVTPGLRFQMAPHPRLAFYGIAGFGYGGFDSVKLSPAGTPAVPNTFSSHGTAEIGGGFDVRLNQGISLRAEVRDFISGHNLGGASGPNHVVYLFGIAIHH
jgi:hypothetical protein